MDAIWNELKLMQGLLAAAVLSGLIGWQRERHGHNAGLRTHILVGVSAALFIVLSETLVSTFAKQDDQVRFDLIGVLGAVVSGVSFLGAGAIFSSKRGEGHQGTDYRCGACWQRRQWAWLVDCISMCWLREPPCSFG